MKKMIATKKIINQIQGSSGSQGISGYGGPPGIQGNQGWQSIDTEKLLLKAKKVAISINRERKLDSLLDDIVYIPFELEESQEFIDYITACGPQGYTGICSSQGTSGKQKSVIQKNSEKFRRKHFISKVK